MKKEVEAEVKVGDRIRITNPIESFGEYRIGDLGVVKSVGMSTGGVIGVDVQFDHFCEGCSIYVYPEEFELVEEDDSAETIRSNILSIRERRNDLLMEITALGKEEAKLVEKLKERGFVLYEQNEPETHATEKKTVLYAEDIEEDMTNPKNWKVGDFVKVISTKSYYLGDLCSVDIGGVYPIASIFPSHRVLNAMQLRVEVGGREDYDSNGMAMENYVFHSRPL